MTDGVTNRTTITPKKGVRRRRSWYRRRVRIQRMLVAAAIGVLIAGAFWQNLARHFSLPTLHASQVLPDSFWARQNIRKELSAMATRSVRPVHGPRSSQVYAYSVIPGGVKDVSDLRYAAARDYVVRRHYTHFDFEHARLIRAREAREVYLSYRIRDTVYWTRKKIRLHMGEMLLTDGNIIARARCGNQISDTAKPEVSNDEPDQDVLDTPVAELEPGPSFPARPALAPPDLPVGQPIAPKLFANSFIFPYVRVGPPLPTDICRGEDVVTNGKCHPKRPPPTPEPSTIFLIGAGMALIVWRYRRTFGSVTS
ncbi:MAG TPA: PEP-CTERM sorting domain-containing protein [Terriglobales bacterium]|nr:PEP-CTERM sorting domain-containing protein [Terriglobales bacterium]